MTNVFRLGLLRGLILLVVVLTVAALLPAGSRLDLIALLLALTAGIYLGFAWLDGRGVWVAVEGVVAVAFLGVALLGLAVSPLFLAAGFVLHVLWDLAHHPRGVGTTIARWVPPACLLFDLGVAAAVVFWWPPL